MALGDWHPDSVLKCAPELLGSCARKCSCDLRDAFESGLWAQHLQDQKNFAAPVQGVRFFFYPEESSSTDADSVSLLRGSRGYICATPKTAQLDADGAIRMSLEAVKDAVQKGKAWEANRKAYLQLVAATAPVPVLHMTVGRPADRRFGASDCLLGLFECVHVDATLLSCLLRPTASPCGCISAEEARRQAAEALGGGRAVKRRRQLFVYSNAGAQMGPAGRVALTGAHCKDIYVSSLQRAAGTVRLNAFCISDPDVLEELRRAAARGVIVRVRYDFRQQSKTLPICFEEERFRHVEVHPVIVSEDDKLLMHKKELIVDAEKQGFYVTGSYNPTSNARGSQESVCVHADRDVLQLLAERFDADWAQEEQNLTREVTGPRRKAPISLEDGLSQSS
jgi:phosphatidylserine/phosphatidylglycerophosphate/cardiolipin synthase-like enzyme